MKKWINTERLTIKPLAQQDTAALSVLLLHDSIKQTYMIPDFSSQHELDQMLTFFLDSAYAENHFMRGIYLKDQLIGFVNDVEIQNNCLELGYVIHPSYWGNGYATEMLTAVIEELLGKPFSSIKAGAFVDNSASIRVLEKCGMKRLSKLESIEYHGIQHSCVYYEIHS